MPPARPPTTQSPKRGEARMNRRPVLDTIVAGALVAVLAGCATSPASAQSSPTVPPSLVTPDRVQTSIGTLEFTDGAPTVATAEKVRDTLDFTRALNVYNNSASLLISLNGALNCPELRSTAYSYRTA